MRCIRKTSGAEGMVEYGPLVGAIPNKPAVFPSNLDAILEHHGYFLVGETKQPGEGTSDGQLFTLQALAKLPNFRVLRIKLSGDRCENGAALFNPTEYQVLGENSPFKSTTLDDFRAQYATWWAWADRR